MFRGKSEKCGSSVGKSIKNAFFRALSMSLLGADDKNVIYIA
jgi:hypothetical protein